MKYRWLLILLLSAALYSATVAVLIEMKNAEAGFYLPHRGEFGDGVWRPSKWRISLHNTARDQLRGLLHRFGLFQYPINLGLLIGSVFLFRNVNRLATRLLILLPMSTGMVGLFLAFFRSYISAFY